MLYKVTPMMPPAGGKAKKPRDPGAPRKRRKSAIYDAEGHEVLITLMCLKCRQVKPLMQFGLRKMADGAIRNQPWCRPCRSGAGTPKPKPSSEVPQADASLAPTEGVVETELTAQTEAAIEPSAPSEDELAAAETVVEAASPAEETQDASSPPVAEPSPLAP